MEDLGKEIDATDQEMIAYCKKLNMFRFFDDHSLQDLVPQLKLCEYQGRSRIIKEGETATKFFGVVKGQVEVNVTDPNKDVYITTIGSGDTFGEAAIFEKVKRTANVWSLDYALLMHIERKSILQFIKKHPSDGIKFLMVVIYGMIRKLREANQELAFERKDDSNQENIDEVINQFLDS